MNQQRQVTIDDIKEFWNSNPLCAAQIPYKPGTPEFFHYYDKLREDNESVAFSYALHEYKNFSGKNVLDVGCGNGYVLNKYAREGARVTGVDVTDVAIELTEKRFQLSSLQGNFMVANAEELPFLEGIFDCVCSMGVLHHTPNPMKGFREIYRVLKHGGSFICMVYHRDSAFYTLGMRLRSRLTGKSMEKLVNEADGSGNPKGEAYTRAELIELLDGFKGIKIFVGFLRGEMLVPRIGRFIPKQFFCPFERKFGWFLYAKAIKP